MSLIQIFTNSYRISGYSFTVSLFVHFTGKRGHAGEFITNIHKFLSNIQILIHRFIGFAKAPIPKKKNREKEEEVIELDSSVSEGDHTKVKVEPQQEKKASGYRRRGQKKVRNHSSSFQNQHPFF